MRTDGMFTVSNFDVPFEKWGEPIYIGASGDWHRYSNNHDAEKFIAYLKKLQDLDAYLVGAGDYTDLMSCSERISMGMANLHDQTKQTLDEYVVARVKELGALVKKYLGNKTIGLVGGNHYYETSYGISSDKILCQEIGCPYLGVNALFRLNFRYPKSNFNLKQDWCVHHGLGGGRTPGSSINKLWNMANSFDADIMLMGHDHNRCIDKINRLGLDYEGKYVNKSIIIGRTGSFLRSYEPNKASYATAALYPPSDLGGLVFKVTPMRKGKIINGKREEKRYLQVETII